MDRALKTTLFRGFVYFVVLEVLIVMAVEFWPDFQKSLPFLKTLELIPIAKDLIGGVEKTGVVGYVVLQQFFKGGNALGTAAAVLFSMNAVAGEAERGTLEIWLARPVSRSRQLLERWIAGAVALTVPIFLSSATIPWLLPRVDQSMELAPLMWMSVHQSLFLLAVYAAAFLWSCASSRPMTIAFTMLVLGVFQFSLYAIKTVTHWSIFRLSDLDVYLSIHTTGGLDWKLALPLALATALGLWLSLVVFARRVP